MKIKCPSCGADNDVEELGGEVVCWSCFHAWSPEPGGDEEPTAMMGSMDDMESGAGFEIDEGSADKADSIDGPAIEASDPFAFGASADSPDDAYTVDVTGEGLFEAAAEASGAEVGGLELNTGTGPQDVTPDPTDDEPGTDTSYLFRRRRHRSLSQTDVAVIGTYQRRSTEIPQSDDIVWKEGTASEPVPQPPRESRTVVGNATGGGGEAYNPFGDTEVVWGAEPDSGTGGSTGWGTETGIAAQQPAAAPGDDPFAQVDGAAFGSEFGGGASAADDPFGNIDTGGLGDDPFAANPFADDSEPFGGEGDDQNPFSTSDFAQDGEGFDDFGFASLDDGGGDDFAATTDAGEARLEIDLAEGGDGHTSGAAPGGSGAKAGGRRRRRARGNKRGKDTKGGQNKAVILGVTALFCGGLLLGETDMGYFGMNLFLGDSPPSGAEPLPNDGETPSQGASEASGQGQPGSKARRVTGDAPADFARSIEGLKQKVKLSPTDKGAQQELVAVLLRCKERHPEFFESRKYVEDLTKYGTAEIMSKDLQLQAQKLLSEGKRDEAQAALMQHISSEQNNPEILYLLARISLQNKNEDGAIDYYKATLATDAVHQAALYDLGGIYLKRQELSPAREYLERLLAANTSHSGAKLAMAQITLYEKGYDDTKVLIEEALSAAKNTQNDDEQFRAFWLSAMLAEAQQNAEDKSYALGRALELRPDDERTALELSGLLGLQGKHQEALIRLQTCQKAGGGTARFYEALVKAYEATNDPDTAKSQLNEALRKHPKDTGLLMLQAEGERQVEHYKTAKSIYANIIENEPSFNRAYLALATLQFQEGRQQESVETLSQGATVVEEKLPILEKKAEYQMKIGATLRAKETMGEILTIDPNNTDVKLRFATLLKKLGYADEAARYYRDLQIAGALDATTLLDYAEVLIKLNRYDDAFKHVEAVIGTDPLNLRANVLRGAVHTAKGEYKVADEDLRKALKVNSTSADAYYYLGRNEMSQGRVTAAVEYLAKASALASSNNSMRADLARAYTEVGGIDNRRKALGQYTQIVNDYERYTSKLDRKRIDPDIYFRRGRLFYENGQHREALSDFKQAMILDPVREDAIIEFARTLNTMGKRTEAEAYLKEILARDPKNPSAHYEMGEIALKTSRRTEAEDHFKQAIAAGGANFPTAHRYLGYLYKEKGLTTLSCNSFKEYLRVAPKSAYDREEIARQTSRMCR
jgi:tetratricopeptide (TPR) repeat protein